MAEWRNGKPAKSGWYRVRWKQNTFGCVSFYNGRSFFDGEKWGRNRIIGWQPLPEPVKPVSE